MPPKSKRKLQLQECLEKAREAKIRRESGEGTSGGAETEVRSEDRDESTFVGLATMSDDALDTEDETVDPTFDVDSSMKSDIDHVSECFCEDWVCHLGRDDRVSLGLFLCFKLSKLLDLGETKAAELAGIMIGKSDKVVREWRSYFTQNGEIPQSQQGGYQRSGVLWTNEDLNKKATEYI